MKKNITFKLIPAFILTLQLINANSQNTSYLISNSGGDYSATNGKSMIWTLGDFMTENIGNNNIATQGFLQPEMWNITANNEIEISDINIYPNPFTSYINVDLPDNENFYIKLIDIKGSTLLVKKNITDFIQINDINLNSSTYFLIIREVKTSKQNIYKLIHLKQY